MEGGSQKIIYRGNCLKRGLGQFGDLEGGGGVGEKEGGVDTPMHTMNVNKY